MSHFADFVKVKIFYHFTAAEQVILMTYSHQGHIFRGLTY